MAKKMIEFGPDQTEALEQLADDLGESQAGIVRAGLALLQIAVRETRRGHNVGIVSSGRVLSEMTGVWSHATKVDSVSGVA